MVRRALTAVCLLGVSHGVVLESPYTGHLRGVGCSDLVNQGTHFTIDVSVGTPGQVFSVVADTGSNTLIVPSCLCQQKGKCPASDKCFVGTNRSSSFSVEQAEGINGPEPVSMVLTFGSGQIQGVVAKDEVSVGGLNAFMDDGLLLMTDRALNIQGPFEGILGLGLPQKAAPTPPTESGAIDMAHREADIAAVVKQIMASKGVDKAATKALNKLLEGGKGDQNATKHVAKGERTSPKGFLEQAHTDTFSMCFNHGGNGVLRIGAPAHPEAHGSYGTQHWGLGFEGISVGSGAANRSAFCTRDNMAPGQVTPCGAIPDSGTTLFMAPAEHIGTLLDDICDRWDRCATNYTKFQAAAEQADRDMVRHYGTNPFNMKGLKKADIFQMLLMDCATWMTDAQGLDELPPLHFHVVGKNYSKQVLEIPSHSYIMEVSQDQVSNAIGLLQGVGRIPINTKAPTNATKICSPAFGVMDYPTKLNGPVWILGTSLFYEYTVGYDTSVSPPTISFAPQSDAAPCGSCSANVNLAAVRPSHSTHAKKASVHKPMRLHSPPRMPSIDTTKPL